MADDEELVGPHASMDDHGHDDHNMGEGHEAVALGPIDVPAWGAFLLGILLGLVMLVAFILATT